MAETGARDGLLSAASFEELGYRLEHIARLKEMDGDPQWRLPRRLKSHLLVAIRRGDAQFTIDGCLVSLRTGALFIGAPGQSIEYMGGSAAAAEDGYALLFAVTGNRPGHDAIMRNIGREREGGVVPETFAAVVLELCETAHRHWHQPSGLLRLRSQAAFYEILYNVLHHALLAEEGGLYAALEQVKQYLDTHFERHAPIERLAERIGVSPRHFRRAFKQAYGLSATDYVTDLRMAQAKRMMATTRLPVAEIARKVGYQEESHFRRTFKRQMGVSPSAYVKNRALKVAACSFPNIGQLLPLCVIPFAAPIDHDWTDYYRRKYDADVLFPLHHNNEINRRTLLAARPDRIVAIDAFGTADFQDKLGEIAPVLVIPWRTRNWREHLLLTASFLDKTNEAERWLSAYDDKADLACEQLERIARRERLLVVLIDRHACYRWTRGTAGDKWDRAVLPFAPARHAAKPDPSFAPLDPASLEGCETDRIVLLLSEDRHSQQTWRTLRHSGSWRKLGAVRHNRVHTLLLGPWFEYTAYNHGVILDQALKSLK